MDNTEQSPAILSLCTGMRGLERGIERAIGSVRTIAYVEIEAFVIENLVRQMEQGVLAPAPVWSNVKTFPSEEFHRKIHGITGGYPCQPFSVAGKRGGEDDPRHLWPHIKRMVGTIRPVWCFFENVPGHLSLGYREVRSDLEQLGYKVEEGIFSAEEVGAPHQRKRLFILAIQVEYATTSGFQESGYARLGQFKKKDRTGLDYRPEQSSNVDNSHSERQQPQHEVCTGRNSVEHAGEGDMADTNSSRGWENSERGELRTESIEQSSGYCRRTNKRENGKIQITRWPARPSEQQYEWEAPRVESSMGYAINGHNYREDLLRMAGNAVVEQVAELAWKTLWNKF